MKTNNYVTKLTKTGLLVISIMLGACNALDHHGSGSGSGGGGSDLIPSPESSPNGVSLPAVSVLGAATVTSTGLTTITGNLGLYPGTSITGFPPGIVTGTKSAANSISSAYQAQTLVAYNELAGSGFNCTADISGMDLGGRTLTPGIYCSSTSIQLTGNLTLDSQGVADQVFIFKTPTTLTVASNSNVIRTDASGEAFWKVGSSATLGSNSHFVGHVLAFQSITLNSAVTVSGKLLAMHGAVTLIADQIAH